MNTIEIFNLAQLAEAAYGSYVREDGSLIGTDTQVQNILQGLNPDGTADSGSGMSFSETQVRLFTDTWAVEAHQPNTGSGFSATLFRNKTTGELVYAKRGTEGSKLSLSNFLNLGFLDAFDDVSANFGISREGQGGVCSA